MKNLSSSNLKNNLHNNNIHIERYDLDLLIQFEKDLSNYIILNPKEEKTIDFSNPLAILLLNKALLKCYYKIDFWEIKSTNLCPPIPGRVDYIHYISDLIKEEINVKIIDIGTGASLIYPILGVSVYNWKFIATDIDQESIRNAQNIILNNSSLKNMIELRTQNNPRFILRNIINNDDKITLSMCNPPFFKSKEESYLKTTQKLTKLGKISTDKPIQNFSGQNNEIWCKGGELAFIQNYIYESVHYSKQIKVFTSLVSNKEHLYPLQKLLKKLNATSIDTIQMSQGNKISRILVWKF